MPCTVPVSEFARSLGVDPKTVRRWAHLGIVNAERVGPRLMFVDPDSLRREAIGPEPSDAGGDS